MMNLQIGSRGAEVSDLQRRLNARGYALDVDGAFGPATAAAVRDYQAKAGLSADGVVGPLTRAALDGDGASGVLSDGLSGASSAYHALIEGVSGASPAPYQSPYGDRLTALYDAIASRRPFTYDPNGDAQYRRYRDSYVSQGRAAMNDTLGRAAALTGGYASSYGQSAGQAAYQSYLAKLWDLVPGLRDRALKEYQAETDALRSDFKALSDAEKAAYARYEGYLKQFNADRTYAQKAEAQAFKEAQAVAKSAASGAKSSSKSAKSSSKSSSRTAQTTAARTYGVGRAVR